jgi:hypothetical protein
MVVAAVAFTLLTFGLLAQESAAMTTYSGDCSFKGITHAFPGAHWIPVPGGYEQEASGHCTGTLDGSPFDGPISMHMRADMHAPMSCAGGYWLEGGPLYITFLKYPPPAAAPPAKASAKAAGAKERRTSKKRHRRRHRHPSKPPPVPAPPPEPPENPVLAVWTYDLHAPPGMAAVGYSGAYRGWAVGTNHLDTPPSTIDECNGPGVHEIGFDGTFSTIQELHG